MPVNNQNQAPAEVEPRGETDQETSEKRHKYTITERVGQARKSVSTNAKKLIPSTSTCTKVAAIGAGALLPASIPFILGGKLILDRRNKRRKPSSSSTADKELAA